MNCAEQIFICKAEEGGDAGASATDDNAADGGLGKQDSARFNRRSNIFCKVYNEQRKKYGQTKETIMEAIRICKDRNVLKEYLESKEKEVVDMYMSLFDEDYVMEAYMEAYAKEREDNRDRETAKRMIKDREMSLEKIARYVPSLSMDELRELEAEIMQMA